MTSTVRAIEQRTLNVTEIKAVLASVSAGVNLGLAERGGDIAQSLRAAVSGMDQALIKFAQSTQLMIEEMLTSGSRIPRRRVETIASNLARSGTFTD